MVTGLHVRCCCCCCPSYFPPCWCNRTSKSKRRTVLVHPFFLAAMPSCSCLTELYYRSSSFDTPGPALFGSNLEISANDEHCIACSCSSCWTRFALFLFGRSSIDWNSLCCQFKLSHPCLLFSSATATARSTQAAAAANQPHCSAATHP